jgi:hypothetical protein
MMDKKNIRIIIPLIAALLILPGCSIIYAQFDTTLMNNVFKAAEKLYVMCDRNYYMTGDTIRYNVILRRADLQENTSGSSIVYFDLSGPRENDFFQWRLAIVAGTGSGEIVIPDGLATGVYRLRANTRWMRNGSSGYFFNSNLLIVNVTDEEVSGIALATSEAGKPLIEFFPEGGKIVRGLINHIGYRVNGFVRPDSLVIAENDSITGPYIYPDQSGTGSFSIFPQSGHDYSAFLFFAGGVYQKYPLPRMSSYGEILHCEQRTDGTAIYVASKPEMEGESKLLHLTVICKGIIIKDTVFYASTGDEILLKKTREGEGLIYIALHDSKKFLLAERLFYVSPDMAVVNIKSELKPEYGRGENVKLTVIPEETGLFETATLSISVAESNPFYG